MHAPLVKSAGHGVLRPHYLSHQASKSGAGGGCSLLMKYANGQNKQHPKWTSYEKVTGVELRACVMCNMHASPNIAPWVVQVFSKPGCLQERNCNLTSIQTQSTNYHVIWTSYEKVRGGGVSRTRVRGLRMHTCAHNGKMSHLERFLQTNG